MWGGRVRASWLLVVVVVVVLMVGGVESGEIVIGGARGWTTGFNYESWSSSQNVQIRVGDRLVFKNFDPQVHTVALLNDPDSYQRCLLGAATNTTPIPSGANFTLVIPANLEGMMFYAVCTIPGHCTDMQKIHGLVIAALGSSTAPPPGPALSPGAATSGSSYPGDADMNRYICWTTAILLIAACFWPSA